MTETKDEAVTVSKKKATTRKKATPQKVVQQKPEAKAVFNDAHLARLLADATWRVTNQFESIRIDAELTNPKHANLAIQLGLQALQPEGSLFVLKTVADLCVVQDSVVFSREVRMSTDIGAPLYQSEDAGAGYVKITK